MPASSDLPEYYRHLVDPPNASDGDTAAAPDRDASAALDGAPERASSPAGKPRAYYADVFQVPLPDDEWADATDYMLLGPVSGGLRHNITVHVDLDAEDASLTDYSGAQMASLEAGLPDGRLLMHGPLTLDGGHAAYRAIFRWQPEDRETPLYQEQIYVVHDGAGYTLTASFTDRTRKRFGPRIERMMRTFQPVVRDPAAA